MEVGDVPPRASLRPSRQWTTDITNLRFLGPYTGLGTSGSLEGGPRAVPLLYNGGVAVNLRGRVVLVGAEPPGTQVTVVADGAELSIVVDGRSLGVWDVHDVGLRASGNGFRLRVHGEHLELHTEDDAALADELGLATLTPRLARQVATRHNPEPRPVVVDEPMPIPSRLASIAFAVGGGMVLLGGSFLARTPSTVGLFGSMGSDNFWGAFVLGGTLMVAAAFIMSIGVRWARAVALVVLLATIGMFGLSASGAESVSTAQLTAYGFIAGGVVIGIAVMVAGSLRDSR